MKRKGYKTNKKLTDIRNQIIFDGWEKYKNEITMEDYFLLLEAMPVSLPHLYLLLRKKKLDENKKVETL